MLFPGCLKLNLPILVCDDFQGLFKENRNTFLGPEFINTLRSWSDKSYCRVILLSSDDFVYNKLKLESGMSTRLSPIHLSEMSYEEFLELIRNPVFKKHNIKGEFPNLEDLFSKYWYYFGGNLRYLKQFCSNYLLKKKFEEKYLNGII
jgi:hypothetical protein